MTKTRSEKLQYRDAVKRNYELRCIRQTIIGKEKAGLDASFERNLLKKWAKYEGRENSLEYLP